MKLLVIDTATEACSVALEVDGKLYHRFEVCPQQHSQRLLPMVDEVLQEAECTVSELDYLGFGRGPGSFTGVRIATGMIQGLALGSGLHVVGVSTLAAMAQQAAETHGSTQETGLVAAIDARMDEVYFGQYQWNPQSACVELVGEEAVLPPAEAKTQLHSERPLIGVGTGWAAYTEALSAPNLKVEGEVLYPDARYMLPLAKQAIAAGQAGEIETIEPVYLRDKVTWKKLPGRE